MLYIMQGIPPLEAVCRAILGSPKTTLFRSYQDSGCLSHFGALLNVVVVVSQAKLAGDTTLFGRMA